MQYNDFTACTKHASFTYMTFKLYIMIHTWSHISGARSFCAVFLITGADTGRLLVVSTVEYNNNYCNMLAYTHYCNQTGLTTPCYAQTIR